MSHIPVLLHESIAGLDIKPEDIVLDGTLGNAGHSIAISKILNKKGHLISFDRDQQAVTKAKKIFSNMICKHTLVNDNFINMDKVFKKRKINHINKMILDVGLSSEQIENSNRGFSFKKEEPILMTFDNKPSQKNIITAKEILNTWSESTLADILYGYGDERFARKIAKKIIEYRTKKEIKTTKDLIDIINSSVPLWYKKQKMHYATKTFQAIRIAVNDEITALSIGLEKGFKYLLKDGRIAVISFHSVEDRVVKRFCTKKKHEKKGEIITKKPITPSRTELLKNPRSRSAKLRIIKKI